MAPGLRFWGRPVDAKRRGTVFSRGACWSRAVFRLLPCGVLTGLLVLLSAAAVESAWRTALPGWEYGFPRDHGNHPDFKTEWWYFTGNLKAADGREFGYQLTFFRQGVMEGEHIPLSRFVTRDVKFAHFAVSDLSAGKFHFFQKLSRGAFGEAGFDDPPRLAWIDDWVCELTGDHGFRLRAEADGVAIALELDSRKAPVFHGADGVSQKAEGAGRASHYYSLTRLATSGTVRVGGEVVPVTGWSWFDHEWATNQLEKNQVGWDWLSLQFDDGSELMLFQLRDHDGGRDPYSSGTFVDALGVSTPIADADFTMEAGETWRSPQTGGSYPVRWKIGIPKLDLHLDVWAGQNDQELRLQPVVYWEGAIRAAGRRAGRSLTGSGYLEMTGYAGPVTGMQER